MLSGDKVRVKAGTPVYEDNKDMIGRPYVFSVGVPLTVQTVSALGANVETADGKALDYIHFAYLEPWVDGETWNGSAWVTPKPVDLSHPTRVEIRVWIETAATTQGGYHATAADFYDALKLALEGKFSGFARLADAAILYADDLGVEIVKKAIETNRDKGHDYTGGSPDTLRNFYKVAGITGTTPLQTWGVYVAKHLDAIETYMTTGKVASEPIESRLVDVLVYAALGHFIAIREGK